MKVILLQDVKNVGRKGELREVAQGYGANVLVPKKLALAATPESLKSYEASQKKKEGERQMRNHLLAKLSQDLKGKEIVIKEKANKEGHLFQKIKAEEIVSALKSQASIDIEESSLHFSPIKSVGQYEITFKEGDYETRFSIHIEAL